MDKKRNISLIIVHAALVLLSVACIIFSFILINNLDSQKEAERWQGESKIDFSQISVFLPVSSTLDISSINSFRTQVDTAVKEQLNDDYVPFRDAYSCEGELKVTSDRASATVPVIAVGGNFFDFHPLKLLSGCYINDTDNDLNRIVIDNQLAWLLFGSYDVAGLEVKVNDHTFYIAGVIETENDYATKKAYTYEMCMYMNYRTYGNIVTGKLDTDSSAEESSSAATPGITCYEIVLADPVKNFAKNLVTEKFPVKDVALVENTSRYNFSNLLSIIKDFSARVISSNGVAYPYWENAARYTENKVSSLILFALLSILLPALRFIQYIYKVILCSINGLRTNVLPKMKDKYSEKLRLAERKRWEKNNPDVK